MDAVFVVVGTCLPRCPAASVAACGCRYYNACPCFSSSSSFIFSPDSFIHSQAIHSLLPLPLRLIQRAPAGCPFPPDGRPARTQPDGWLFHSQLRSVEHTLAGPPRGPRRRPRTAERPNGPGGSWTRVLDSGPGGSSTGRAAIKLPTNSRVHGYDYQTTGRFLARG